MGEIMAEKNENLNMDLFDRVEDLELNFDGNPEEEDNNQDDINQDQDEDQNNDDENINNDSSEDDQNDDDSEEVASEDQNDEGDDSEDSDNDDETDDDSPNTLYSSFASVLSEKGLLPSLDLEKNEIKDIDDLTESIKSEIQNQSKQYILDKLGEDGYNALEKGISLSEYQQHQDTVKTLDNINDEVLEQDLELAKRIIQQDYINQGMDEKRVNKLLKKSIDLGDESVLEDAKDSLESLKATQAKKLEQVAAQREAQMKQQAEMQEKIDNDLKNNIYNNDEFIKGIKVNKAVKDKVYESITKIVGKNENGIAENRLMKERRENPIEFDTKLYYLYEITKGFKDFSNLVSKSESKALSKLENQLRKNKFEGSNTPTYMDDPDSYDSSIGSELNI